MLIRAEIGLGLLIIILVLGWYVLHLQKQSAVALSTIEQQKKSIDKEKADKELTEKTLTNTINQREALRNELDKTKAYIGHLHFSAKEKECNDIPLPAGYIERVYHPNNEHKN